MTTKRSPESRTEDPPIQTGGRDSSSVAFAVTLHTIKLHESAHELEFEKFMLNDIFPSIDT